ncbi:MAG: hypothetical protein R6V39_12125 [Desulfovibrionales bacterium]
MNKYKSINILFGQAYSLLRDSAKACLELFRIMIPIIIAVRILQDLGLISYLAVPLEPVMQLMGLPGSMGLVWATALVNNIYAGMIVFVSLPESAHLSIAQVTVLSTVMLVAHALPVELKIAQKTGPRLVVQGIFRVGSAFILGILLNLIYSNGNLLQEPSTILWNPDPAPSGYLQWALAQGRNLTAIFAIITSLMALTRILDKLRITNFFIRALRPLFQSMGIGRQAGPISIIGMIMGLSYGGGLIIHEVKNGNIPARDVFFSMTLMGICHSVIEDTLLMLLLGADLSGILWARIIYALIFTAIIVRVQSTVSDKFSRRYLYAETEQNYTSQ